MRRQSIVLLAALALLPFTSDTRSAPSQKTVGDYRYFRALTIDLLGRAPTRAEIAAFEQPDFDIATWIDTFTQGTAYAQRLRRVYADLLKLEIPPTVAFAPMPLFLRRQKLVGPDGPFELYFREGQRRAIAEIDGDMCFTESESGMKLHRGAGMMGTPKPIARKLLEQRTVLVKPWWLYSDYRSAHPKDRAGAHWKQQFPGYVLHLPLFVDPDGRETMAVRVCREEAQTSEHGRVFVASRRLQVPAGERFPAGRLTHQPPDLPYAQANVGKSISCLDQTGYQTSHECGCGPGLERCIPVGPSGFTIATHAPLGIDEPFQAIPRGAIGWVREWWSEEANRLMEHVFEDDRDVRELLTGKGTTINGPLAQFYRGFSNSTCCRNGLELGYAQAEPLFDRTKIPADLTPHQTARWVPIADRGPHAAGLMTMPIFLKKYPTRRARAYAIYRTFLCKDFVAPAARLAPSNEPDLAKRPGCAACHRTLEPAAAYFSRIQESDWTYLPPAQFPAKSSRCASADPDKMTFFCKTYYDPAFSNGTHAILRGAHGSFSNAEAGPAGLAAEIVARPEFATCVAQNVAKSFLGRPLEPADEALKQTLAKQLVDGGYRMRPVIKALLASPAYRERAEIAP